ncbi:hypothetical protein OG943_36970 [Amycolatopsis sp. NBC_00345]|uniref:hypothetical protein n=1 Tax=Amycolatopsis sp. NBC_00345 TaxID=2975955 RepID=UPI002E2703AE
MSSKAAKQQSSKAAKQQSSKAAKQQSSKAAKQQSSKWETFGSTVVLGVARTWTSAIRLLDVFASFRDDLRLRFVFTVDPGSQFSRGTEELLILAGAHVIPWRELPGTRYTLAVSASENINFEHIDGPVLVLPHGVGFHKYVPDSSTSGMRISGLVPEHALRTGRVLMAVSHSNQENQLLAASPAAAGRTVVIGDPQFEQLLASAGHREHYRRVLGIGDRRFALVTSTWGTQSLIARRPRLPAELLAALPHDEYAGGLVLHPNIWARYRPFQLHAWFAAAEDAGLLLLPPELGWQAALVAADLVIGDHGSVTFLAAASEKPVLLGTFGEESVPGTSAAMLGERAQRLHRSEPLRTQLDAAETAPWQKELASRTFENTDGATAALHTLVYRLLDLELGPVTTFRAADPASQKTPVTAFTAYPVFNGQDSLTLQRFARSVERWRPEAERAAADLRHLVVDEGERDIGRLGIATVLTRSANGDDPSGWCAEALRRHPGCVLAAAAVPGGCVAVTADGVGLAVTGSADVPALASTAYAILRSGPCSNRTVQLHLGAATAAVELQY